MPKPQPEPQEAASDSTLLTLTAVARKFGLHRETIQQMVDSGGLRFVRLPGGARRVPAREVDEWIERRLVREQSS
ncbi:MAG: Helix-turn-helix domain [Candidatus Eremiobacteraeota bacterium]|nr:Helix-turn-helix domain [Candidatus Eremiobacteraeota bacterium]